MECIFHLYYPDLTAADIDRHQLQLRLLHRVSQRFRDSRSISCDSFFKTNPCDSFPKQNTGGIEVPQLPCIQKWAMEPD